MKPSAKLSFNYSVDLLGQAPLCNKYKEFFMSTNKQITNSSELNERSDATIRSLNDEHLVSMFKIYIPTDEFREFVTICTLIISGHTTAESIVRAGGKLLGKRHRERLEQVLWRYADGPVNLWPTDHNGHHQLMVDECAV